MGNIVAKGVISTAIQASRGFTEQQRVNTLPPVITGVKCNCRLKDSVWTKIAIFYHSKLVWVSALASWYDYQLNFALCDVWAKEVRGVWWRHRRQRIKHLQSQKSIRALSWKLDTMDWSICKVKNQSGPSPENSIPWIDAQWNCTATVIEIWKSCCDIDYWPDVHMDNIEDSIEVVETHKTELLIKRLTNKCQYIELPKRTCYSA